ncbi:ATP-binding protein [Streptacidiphilus sp. N1-3]|uniref:ATP-binding protein n=1 Tax=Streptacidiphilus alkalitolerans TaxID=3342712 RepID=A0ABV6XE71_9ACTN
MANLTHEPQRELFRLPKRRQSVARARTLVVAEVERWGLGQLSDDLSLAVSELVTNAVIHCRVSDAVIEVSIRWIGLTLQLEVADPEENRPVMREGDCFEMGGRGLHLVSALADSWGVRDRVVGKVVWASFKTEVKQP